MVYRDALRSACKSCGRLRRDGERFSVRGKCEECSTARMRANNEQIAARKGPYFERWYASLHSAFEHARLPPDE